MHDDRCPCGRRHETDCAGGCGNLGAASSTEDSELWGDAWVIDARVDPADLGQALIPTPSRHLFPLGRACITPGAMDLAVKHGVELVALLARHASGDWGDVDPDDRGLNDQALRDGSRILSVYTVAPETGAALWIITEAADETGDRAASTILTPEEY